MNEIRRISFETKREEREREYFREEKLTANASSTENQRVTVQSACLRRYTGNVALLEAPGSTGSVGLNERPRYDEQGLVWIVGWCKIIVRYHRCCDISMSDVTVATIGDEKQSEEKFTKLTV